MRAGRPVHRSKKDGRRSWIATGPLVEETPLKRNLFVLVLVALTGLARAHPGFAAEFKLVDGDRVVLIGDTLIERDQKHGYLGTMTTATNPDRAISFRNLGWSADTVRGLSRVRFGPPEEGWQHLIDPLDRAQADGPVRRLRQGRTVRRRSWSARLRFRPERPARLHHNGRLERA